MEHDAERQGPEEREAVQRGLDDRILTHDLGPATLGDERLVHVVVGAARPAQTDGVPRVVQLDLAGREQHERRAQAVGTRPPGAPVASTTTVPPPM